MINLQFFQNWEGKKKKSPQGEQNMCIYVSGICAEGILCLFPGDLKM